jgi:hypothetical protein
MAAKIIMDRSRLRLRLLSLSSLARRKECNAGRVYLGLGRINLDPLNGGLWKNSWSRHAFFSTGLSFKK